MVNSRWALQPRQPIRRDRDRRRRGLGNHGPNGRRAAILRSNPVPHHGPTAQNRPVVRNDTLSRISRYYVENRDRLFSRFFSRPAVQPAAQPSGNDREATAPVDQPPRNDREATASVDQPPRNDRELTASASVIPIGIAVKPEPNPLLWTWKESSVVLIRTEIPDDVWERAKLRYGDLGDKPSSTSSQSPPTPRD
ncbi:hypothetical protein ACI65C_007486 [Semiaphis heraclei]